MRLREKEMNMKRFLLIFLIFISLAMPSWAAQNLSTDTIAHMKDYNVAGGTKYAALANGDVCFVFNASTRDLSIYVYATSSEADDNDIYVRPTGYTTSLWIKMGLNTMGTTMSASANPTMYFNSTATDWWHAVDDDGNSFEWRLNSAIGTNVLMELDESGNLTLAGMIHGGVASVGTVATPITSSGAYALSATACLGSMLYYNDTDPVNLPAALAGMTVGIYVAGTSITTINPDNADTTTVDGTDNAAGHYFSLPGAKGNFVVLHCDVSGHWTTWGIKGTPTLE
jgi:hypothetical protein